jgi:protease I
MKSKLAQWLTTFISTIILTTGLASASVASELGVVDGLKTTTLAPTINTASLLDKNPALKAFFMAPVTEEDMITGKRIAIVTTDGVEEIELTAFLQYLQARGAIVDIVAPKYSPWPEKYAIQYPASRKEYIQTVRFMENAGTIKIDRFIGEVKAVDYDAVVIPGGAWNPDSLRMDKNVLAFVRAMDKAKKPIASICHGPWVLIDAEIVKGRKMTAAWNIHTDLKNAGAIVEDKPLVVDGNLMTSRFPTDLAELLAEMLRQLKN